MDHDSSQMQARLAALADGTLAPGEHEQLIEQIGQRPELARDLERQREAVSVLAALESTKAPETLRRSVESLASGAPRRRRSPRRLSLQLATAGAMAAAAAIVLATSSATRPTVLQAAQAALGSSTLPPPAASSTKHGELSRSVEGIAYPYWQDSFGWRATGAGTDRIAGRSVTTVFYASQSRTGSLPGRIGYSIVAGNALAWPGGGRSIEARGIQFQALRSQGATILTWRRGGHTCILAARGVSTPTLVRLASWE